MIDGWRLRASAGAYWETRLTIVDRVLRFGATASFTKGRFGSVDPPNLIARPNHSRAVRRVGPGKLTLLFVLAAFRLVGGVGGVVSANAIVVKSYRGRQLQKTRINGRRVTP